MGKQTNKKTTPHHKTSKQIDLANESITWQTWKQLHQITTKTVEEEKLSGHVKRERNANKRTDSVT